jgi:phosphoenolpyruvate phosphomutase
MPDGAPDVLAGAQRREAGDLVARRNGRGQGHSAKPGANLNSTEWQGPIESASRLPPGLSLVGGAYDGMSALLVERARFDAVWASGFSISASKLLPDCNVMTVEDLVDQVATMTRATRLPVIVDCDEGYGDIRNTYELARRLRACGAAGVCIEDSAYPKLNSYCDEPGRALADADSFTSKVRAIQAAAPDLIVMARTESLIAGQSLDAALARGMHYAELGVDFVIIHSRSSDLDEFRRLAQAWRSEVPLAVIPTLCHDATWRDFLDLGFGLVIYANHALRASVHAQETVLRDIRGVEAASVPEPRMVSLEHIFDLTNLRDKARLTGFGGG